MKQVYTNIKAIRLGKSMTQEDMASHLKMTQSNYGRLEKGLSPLTVDRLEEIAEIFKMSVNGLLSYDGETDFKENAEYYYNELQKANRKVVKLEKENDELRVEVEDSDNTASKKLDTERAKVKELTGRVKALEEKKTLLEKSIEEKQREIDFLRSISMKLADQTPNNVTPEKNKHTDK